MALSGRRDVPQGGRRGLLLRSKLGGAALKNRKSSTGACARVVSLIYTRVSKAYMRNV